MVFTCASLSPCYTGSPVIVFVRFKSLHYYYRRTVRVLGSALAWIVEGMGGGLDNVS